jgi:hypothetical protein
VAATPTGLNLRVVESIHNQHFNTLVISSLSKGILWIFIADWLEGLRQAQPDKFLMCLR